MTIGSLLLAGFVFFVLRAWFDAGDEIAAHEAAMARLNRLPGSTPALDAAWEGWKRRHPNSYMVTERQPTFRRRSL